MSRVVTSYKKKQNESFYLRSWIAPDILDLARIHVGFPIWPRLDKLIPSCDTTSSSLFNPQNLQNKRHFVKVTGFHKVHNYTVYGSVRDDFCHILVEFTPQCVSEFERYHSIRITDKTVNTLFLIGDVAMKYVPVRELHDPRKWSMMLGLDPRISVVPVLVIGQCLAFDLDQVEASAKFPYLYHLESFSAVFGRELS
ncbi:LANO_0H19108g1_1 [Lachancea nothofagi CBS 11611]|uniref:Telomere replication protein EST3 n=1 Tax=Lachancea nothofagi CBS 11611 TaxID=1266666 RepID=A0A1G4KN80_9SACH|nr:LANO_0H19108g1_1 [Lachancea nothofagi CBS 11611]